MPPRRRRSWRIRSPIDDGAARSRSIPPRLNTRVVLRVQGMASPRARRPRAAVSPMAVGQHAAAGVRVAPAGRRRRCSSSIHLRRRGRPEAGRRDDGRQRRRHRRRQHPQRARRLRGPGRRQRPTCAAPSGATTAPSWCSPPRGSAAGGLDSVAARRTRGGTCTAADQQRRARWCTVSPSTTSTRCSRPTAASCSRRRAPGR